MLTVRDLDPQTDDLTGWLAVIKLAFKDHHGPVGPDEVTVRRPGYRESLLSCAQRTATRWWARSGAGRPT